MNLSQHTVTIPIADYHQLIGGAKESQRKFEEMKSRLVGKLESLKFTHHIAPDALMYEVIKTIQETK